MPALRPSGVLDLGDGAADAGVDVGAVFKGTVAGGVEGTVFEGHVVHVAEGLLATDVAAHQTHPVSGHIVADRIDRITYDDYARGHDCRIETTKQ